MQNYIQVITATETKKEAENIAHILTEKRLAGCVQIIGPITSIYWWRGKIEKPKERLCFIKARTFTEYCEPALILIPNNPF